MADDIKQNDEKLNDDEQKSAPNNNDNNNNRRKSRTWCMTINNPAAGLANDIKACDFIKAGIVGEERGANGTPHLQIYVQTKRHMLFNTFRNKIFNALAIRPHIEIARGSVDQNVEYCSKEDENPLTWGTFSSQGRRTDIKDIYEMIKNGKKDHVILDKYPAQYMHMYKGINTAREVLRQAEAYKELQDEFSDVQLREWQQTALDLLLVQNKREIHWYVDYIGNKGKSFLADLLVALHDGIIFNNGKSSDIAYAYNGEPVIAFDFTRDKQDIVNYSVIEDLKNGRIFSPKYASKNKIFKKPKIIVFSNWDPDTNKLSEDRWRITHLSNNDNPVDQLGLPANGFLFPEDVNNNNNNHNNHNNNNGGVPSAQNEEDDDEEMEE